LSELPISSKNPNAQEFKLQGIFRGQRLWEDDREIAAARLVGSQSGSGLPHSKTLRESEALRM